MPSAAARRLYEDQIPSLMSVFEVEDEVMQDRDTVTVVDAARMMDIDSTYKPDLSNTPHQFPQPNIVAQDPSHRHNGSTSTTNLSESAGSSPTTMGSCTDSSSPSDPSPSSSPDSPVNLVPLKSYPTATFGSLPAVTPLDVSTANSMARPVTAPSPRRRNMKNLSIQPPNATSIPPSIPSAINPISPAFIKPQVPAMKRKPSGLSLNTNAPDMGVVRPTTIEVPPSPAVAPMLQRRALKHAASSPHMLLTGLKSSGFGPAGGMSFPTVPERNESGLSSLFRPAQAPALPQLHSAIPEEDSPIKAQVADRTAFAEEPFRENEGNEDQKSPGYPNGPIAIYEDNVFLYLEPTADEASKFDVVINVAREVLNPFERHREQQREAEETRKQEMANKRASMMTIPDTAISTMSYATAFEFLPEETTPTTPKATFATREPEYIHMPWDHNTDIGPDLMNLCELIDRKTKEGLRVLVHCQQGASRSASLIIAYGLYQNPEMSVNDAYYKAQGKSRWISPNMKLMYCLQDFQKEVSKRRLSPGSAYKSRSSKSPAKHRLALSLDAIEIPAAEQPRTAPLPDEEASAAGTAKRADGSPMRPRGNSTPNSADLFGPSSAPSSFSWAEKEDEADPGRFGRFNRSDLAIARPQPQPQASTSMLSRSFDDRRASPLQSPGFAPAGFGSLSVPESPGLGGFVPMMHGRFATFSDPSSMMPGAFPSFSDAPTPPTRAPPPPPMQLPTVAATPPAEDAPVERTIHFTSHFANDDDMTLMSPRAETMTNNPLHSSFAEMSGMHFVESPPTPDEGVFSPAADDATTPSGLFSPTVGAFPKNPFGTFAGTSSFTKPPPSPVVDPRSPPMKGEAPIVRSIDEIL